MPEPRPKAQSGDKARIRLDGGRRRPAGEVLSQLRRFPRPVRMPLEALAAEHGTYEDLIFSAPAAAAAIVARRGPSANRSEALARLRAGAPTRAIFAALELPIWLRRVPPEACGTTPPQPFGPVSTDGAFDVGADAAFGRRALGAAPTGLDAWAAWFHTLLLARAAVGDAFGLWCATQGFRRSPGLGAAPLWPLCAFAWTSNRHDGSIGDNSCRAWAPDMSAGQAVREAQRWGFDLMLALQRDPNDTPPFPPWNGPAFINGYVIEPLDAVADFEAEADRMRNCLVNCLPRAAFGLNRFYRMTRFGRSMATIELTERPGRDGLPTLVQFRGKSNRSPTRPQQRAVEAWLSADGPDFTARRPPSDRLRRALEPYLDHLADRPMPTAVDGGVRGRSRHGDDPLAAFGSVRRFLHALRSLKAGST